MKERLELLKIFLKDKYTSDEIIEIEDGLKEKKYTTFRINTLKINNAELESILEQENILYQRVSFLSFAYIVLNKDETNLKKLAIYKDGKIYLQSLSSMLPPIFIEPNAKENILDMAASPGGKTTEMYNLSEGKALITAVEKNKIRYDRLVFNLEKQDAKRVTILNESSLNLPNELKFDKILLDAPCSGSGTLNENSVFNKKLIENSVQLQRKLLDKAVNLLNKGGILVYSTCSILREENEENVEYLFRENKVRLVPVNNTLIKEEDTLQSNLDGTLLIKPSKYYEGFFVAKFIKL